MFIKDARAPQNAWTTEFDRCVLWERVGVEPWRHDGLPADCSDLLTLDYWANKYFILVGARSDAEQYIHENPKIFERNCKRAQAQTQRTRERAIRSLTLIEGGKQNDAQASPVWQRYTPKNEPPPPEAPPAPDDELPVTVRMALQRQREQNGRTD